MWGNLPGWIISALMLVGSGAMFYKLSVPPPESTPTNLMPEVYNPIGLATTPPEKIVPPGPSPADAGPLYAQAIIEYRGNPKPYDDPIHAAPGDLPAVGRLLQAADRKRMTVFESHPLQLINYNNEQPELEALIKIADAADTIGLGALLDGKLDEATKHFTAVFALGRHLFEERVAWRELSAGLGMMSDAAQNLAKVAERSNDAARVTLLRQFQEEADKYRVILQETVASPLTNPVESYASKFAGDIFAVAKDTRVERVWRVEAILHLGRYRWNVASERRGDQVWAPRELRALENSLDEKNGDVIIRTAIEAAQNLTVEQQRKNTAIR